MASWRAVRELPRRSGATDAETALALPGDELVPAAGEVVDRCTTLAAPPEQVWPWIAQLGKGRAGWYFPGTVERLLPKRGRGLRAIDPALQHARGRRRARRLGAWAGRRCGCTASMRRVRSCTSRCGTRRRGERWPTDDRQDRDDVLAFSWALVLRDAGGGFDPGASSTADEAASDPSAVRDDRRVCSTGSPWHCCSAACASGWRRDADVVRAGAVRRGRRAGHRVQLALPAVLRRGGECLLRAARAARSRGEHPPGRVQPDLERFGALGRCRRRVRRRAPESGGPAS